MEMKIEKTEESGAIENVTESEENSVGAVVGAVLILSIPLALCCYLLLKYVL